LNHLNGLSACRDCLCLQGFGYHKFPANAHGNPKSSVWLVGADPRNIAGQLNPVFWRGASAINLRNPLEEEFGKPLEALFYLTDVVKCQRSPAQRRIPIEALHRCPQKWLQLEIEALRPRVVIALGSDAAQVLSALHTNEAIGEVEYLPHPSPANGLAIRQRYGGAGWEGYMRELIEVCSRAIR
jgi:uracil-DNA glycosylase family 4